MLPAYTNSAAKVIKTAADVADKMNVGSVGTEHLLIGLVKCDSAASEILKKNGVHYDRLIEVTKNIFGEGDVLLKDKGYNTPKAEKVLQNAVNEAAKNKSEKIGTEHILISIIKEPDCVAVRIMNMLGVNIQKIFIDALVSTGVEISEARNEFMALKSKVNNKNKSATPTLDQYSRDLTELAREGKLDAVIGRDKELQSLIQILSRRTKNNPCLIGEPGVGKTAIAEALAQRIVQDDVPDTIKNMRLLTLDLSGMVAGSKYRGEFEERIKKAIREVVTSGNILLFIDEIHTIIGAGGAEGAIDASNILKPSLARGEVQVIGATTIDEYRKYIEKDAALERRFQPVMVEEPSESESIQILNGIKPYYEKHHNVIITDEAIVAAVKLTKRYVNDRYLPDKAIDAMDEASSKLRINMLSMIPNIKKLEEDNKKLEEKKEKALKDGDYEEASSIKKKQEKNKDKLARLRKKQTKSCLDEENIKVTEKEIADIIADWTRIPVNRIQEEETQKLLKLEEILKKRVIGQDEACKAVSKAVRRGRAGLKNPDRPIGSFLFLGPTGVGKTELSKALAEAMFGKESNIIRVDMSEYMEKHSVSKMIGSPPGYVGFEEGGQLSERVRRNPYSVILFDEIEKAHPDVFNILLQVLEDGHITDSKGRKVSFKDTIIIMTSNAGAQKIVSPKLLGFGAQADEEQNHKRMQTGVMEEVKRMFKPEFLNRIDDMIVFRSLTKEDVKSIACLMCSELAKRAKEQMNMDIEFTDALMEHIADKGFDKDYGARPVRRAVQTELEDKLADEILLGNIRPGKMVTMDWNGENVLVRTGKKS